MSKFKKEDSGFSILFILEFADRFYPYFCKILDRVLI